ncbi:MAG: recombinase family protein [Pseudomonadota bacterium]
MALDKDVVRAAQYVRMSTDKQIYSTANQKDSISNYAAVHGFEIIRTYSDEGRSGLRIRGRDALQALLHDVLAADREFDAILVYDISRWGRFQDTDESAYYEFLCRRAGVHVHYCAEQFENDGSPSSAIMKSLRRLMAGEFSRDLSAKVWAGQSRLVSMGYKMGGRAGYGLRRLLIDGRGNPKQILIPGERKSLTTDRVVLIPGDADEIATVRRIFRLAGQGLSNGAIAKALNDDAVPAPEVACWSKHQIRQIVTAERYLGTYIYNKRSSKLGSSTVQNPETKWVKREGGFEPVVSEQQFRAAQSRKRQDRPDYTKAQLLKHLRRLLDEHGFLSARLIGRSAPPVAKTFVNRFGSLAAAYALIGYEPSPVGRYRLASIDETAFARGAADELEAAGHAVKMTAGGQFLTVSNQFVLAPRLCAYRQNRMNGHWRILRSRSAKVHLMLVALMKGGRRERTYLLPVGRFGKAGRIEVSEGRNQLENYEVRDMRDLPEMISFLMCRSSR